MLYRHGPLPRIALDLDPAGLSLSGSGSTQIHARATDGSTVEIGYAAGVISIRRTASGGAPETLYEGRIGPPSHGDLLLGQVHDLFGITVGGARPAPGLERRADSPLHHVRDLGEDAIYWEQPLILSVATAQTYLAAIAAALPGTRVLQTRWRRVTEQPWQMTLQPLVDLASASSPLIVVPAADEARIAAVLAETALTPQRIDRMLPVNLRLQYHWDPIFLRRDADEASQRASQAAGRPVTIHEGPSATVTVRVHAADAAAKAQALTFAKVTDGLFGKELDVVELATGATLKTLKAPRWYGPDVARWAGEGSDRYLAVALDPAGEKLLGYRPRPASAA